MEWGFGYPFRGLVGPFFELVLASVPILEALEWEVAMRNSILVNSGFSDHKRGARKVVKLR